MAREILICDTSFVGHLARTHPRSGGPVGWGEEIVARMDAGIGAISLVTVAEMRAGYLIGRWGGRRMEASERQLAGFVQIPVERDFVGEWARLRAVTQGRGVAIGDNDLWIAATANVRGHPLVTCDRDHERIAPELGVEVVFLRPPI